MLFLPGMVTRSPRAIHLWMNNSYLNKKDIISMVSVSHHYHPGKQRQGPRNTQLEYSPSGPFGSCRTPSRGIKQRPSARSTHLPSSLIWTFHMLHCHLLHIYWFEAFHLNNHSFWLNLIAFLPSHQLSDLAASESWLTAEGCRGPWRHWKALGLCKQSRLSQHWDLHTAKLLSYRAHTQGGTVTGMLPSKVLTLKLRLEIASIATT